MPITAKQSKNTNWNFDVASERLLRQDGSNTAIFANVRTDTNEILGTSTERYGIVQNSDLVDRAEDAFKARGINYERNIYTTDNGSKLRAVYDLKGPNMETRVPTGLCAFPSRWDSCVLCVPTVCKRWKRTSTW